LITPLQNILKQIEENGNTSRERIKGLFFWIFEDWDIENRKLAAKLGYKNFKQKQTQTKNGKQTKSKAKCWN